MFLIYPFLMYLYFVVFDTRPPDERIGALM